MNSKDLADLTTHHIEGIAHQGNTPFQVDLFSQIEDNLWSGGVPVDTAPAHFKFIFSLYPWEFYDTHPHQIRTEVTNFDDGSNVLNKEILIYLADAINAARKIGPTLVHSL